MRRRRGAALPWTGRLLRWTLATCTFLDAAHDGAGHAEAAQATAADDSAGLSWRIVNSEPVEVAWRVRSVQFFRDDACTAAVPAVPNATGDAFASEAAEMTEVEHAFNPRSPRGWESVEACHPGECHVGFSWRQEPVSVRCLLLLQGEQGLHAPGVTLQRRLGREGDAWLDVATWEPVDSGRVRLSLACPPPPAISNGRLEACRGADGRSRECEVRCDAGFGSVEPLARCTHGSWAAAQCLPVGSLVRLVARAPELIKPYWVVLDAALYASEDCTGVVRMDGAAISSGEYVIKYANYHPRNAWDGDTGTSWASREPCTPGSCFVGFQFKQAPGPVRCVRIEHPEGRQFHASQVSVETLGAGGWEEIPGVVVKLLPGRSQEL